MSETGSFIRYAGSRQGIGDGSGGACAPPVFTLGGHGGHTIVDRERSLGMERPARLEDLGAHVACACTRTHV